MADSPHLGGWVGDSYYPEPEVAPCPTVTWTDRIHSWLELPDGTIQLVDIDPRPKVGF